MRRNVELVVDEPSPGHFYWLLLGQEVFGQPREVIDYGRGPLPSHRKATEAGVRALLRHLEGVEVSRMVIPQSSPRSLDSGGTATVF